MFMACIQSIGRVVISDAEFALCRIARPVSRRMYGHTRMPNEKRKEDGQANAVCGKAHTDSDKRSEELFKLA